MPGPSSKGKGKKPKPKQTPTSTSSASGSSRLTEPFVGEIDNATEWHIIVEIMCEMLQIPDLTTRAGLKRVHSDFSNIYRRLNDFYNNHSTNEKITGGVVGIFAKMCADSILRDKLFEKGVLSKLIPLLDVAYCRHLALRSLSVITHHGGEKARKEIARQTPTLLRIMKEHPNDGPAIELATVTLSHAVSAAVFNNDTPDPKLMKILDVQDLLEVVLENMRKPTASLYMMNHAIPLLAGPTLHFPDLCKNYPRLLKFLGASLRSKDLTIRCSAIGGLLRLHHKEAKPERVMHDPQRLMAAIEKGFPGHIQDIMMDYGLYRCDTYATLEATRDFQKAMMGVMQTHDFLALGRTIAMLIVKTEFSVTEGYFEAEDPVTRQRIDSGLPFKLWSDSLPLCVQKLRKTGNTQDVDIADIVELKFLIIRQRISEAVVLAKKAIERNPDIAYYYYAISLGADEDDGLRYSKKGLKCKYITPFLKFVLLYRAVEHAGTLGVSKLQDASPGGDKNYEEGYAFLTSALDDAKEFVGNAPPDSRHMQNILNWYIVLSIVYKGPELSVELTELQGSIKRFEVTSEFARLMGTQVSQSLMRLTRITVLKHYGPGVKEWGDVIARFDSLDSTQPGEIPKEKVEDDLASWLEGTHLGVEEGHPVACSHPKINPNRVELYRCSWCGNPSAVLRKCRACGLTRYCDSQCQQKHWGKHKVACKQASTGK